MMEKTKGVSKWETLNRDILALIFGKLHVMDLTMGASRVCISWFLASHSNTLWNTVDLYTLQQVEEESLNFRNLLSKIIKLFTDFNEVNRNLSNITHLSRAIPKNLFFRFDSYVTKEDLMFAAERMPNIERIVLPIYWGYHTKKSCHFAFSQWKNLKTLIILDSYINGEYVYQAVGENCTNLTNFKYLGHLNGTVAEQMVFYLQSIQRLSLRCSLATTRGVLLLIRRLKNLKILNLSHCKDLDRSHHMLPYHPLVQAATGKLDQLIVCSQHDCKICKDQLFFSWSYASMHWRDDEIKELKF